MLLSRLNIKDGRELWSNRLFSSPVPWGLAVSRDGKIIVTLEDGSVCCFGGESTVPVPYVGSDDTHFIDSARVVLMCGAKNTEIHYTIDGNDPTQNSILYTKPFTLNTSETVRMRAFGKNLLPSFVIAQEFKKLGFVEAKDPGNMKGGLEYDYFEGYFQSVSNFDVSKPIKSGIISNFDLEPSKGVTEFGYIYSGYILIPLDGIYTFYIESVHGSKLYLNGEELIDNDGRHPVIEKSGKIALKKGKYSIVVKHFHKTYPMGRGKMFRVSWEGPGKKKQDIADEYLFHKATK